MFLKIEGAVAPALKTALKQFDSSVELTLDFSSVSRIDSSAIGALETVANTADKQAARVTLQGININVYKVLKLARLASRFSFSG